MRTMTAFLISLTGAVFSALSALGLTDGVCASNGCALFKGLTVFGVDLYWIGAGGFTLLALLALAARRSQSWREVLTFALCVGLLANAGLLGLQAVTVPCLRCLIVATLLGLTGWVTIRPRTLASGVLVLWTLAFAAAVPGLVRESLGPAPILGPQGAAVSIFLSPSCPACSEAVEPLAGRFDLEGKLAIYPVAKNDDDLQRLCRMQKALSSGATLRQALEAAWSDGPGSCDDLPASERRKLELVSWRNKVYLAGAGQTTVPVLITGAPKLLESPWTIPSAGDDGTAAGTREMPSFLAPAEPGCGFSGNAPCEEPAK